MTAGIKICGFTREVDIESAVAAGADAIGLVLAEDAQVKLTEVVIRRLLKVIHEGQSLAIAVLGPVNSDSVQRALDMGFDHVQTVVHEDLALAPDILQRTIPVFYDGDDVEVRIRNWLAAYPLPKGGGSAPFECISIDGPSGGGKGIRADQQRAARVAIEFPLMLAGGLRPYNVNEAIRAVQPVSVDVSSGVESEPGIKCPELMRDFVKAVRTGLS